MDQNMHDLLSGKGISLSRLTFSGQIWYANNLMTNGESGGEGRYHIRTLEDIKDGRLRRYEGELLCGRAIHTFHALQHMPNESWASCSKCVAVAQRFRRSP